MSKTINGKKQSNKNLLKILTPSLIILSPIVIFALYNLVSNPILDSVDHNRFKTLDSQMQGLYGKILAISNKSDAWQYKAACSTNRSGDWPTGDYDCITSISMRKNITSLQELSNMQSQYLPILNNSDTFNQSSSNDLVSTDSFNTKFAVSMAYKDFTEVKTNTKCTYTIQLNQIDSNINYQTNNTTLGSLIENGQGVSLISIRCDGTARGSWYQLIKATSSLIPEL